MFGTHETAVAATYGDAAARLIAFLKQPAWNTASQAAYASGQEVLAQIGPFGAVAGLSKLVRIDFLDPKDEGNALSVALRWEAMGSTGGLFPVLDADLILFPEEGSSTTSHCAAPARLRLLYSYRAPLGRLGAALDAAVLNRVAGATVRSLLDNLAGLLADPQPGQVEAPAPGRLSSGPPSAPSRSSAG